jgi:hypothetical protein
MLRDRGTRDVELRGNLARGEFAIRHEAQDAASAWLGDRPDGGFHVELVLASTYVRRN